MRNSKKSTFVFRGLGFPIKLIDVPMRKILGEWVLDIDFNQLQLTVLHSLLKKSASLNGDELKFIRKFLNLSTTEFGKVFGVTHAAVVKWENGQTHMNPSTDICIRLHLFDHLTKKDKDFRCFYHHISSEIFVKKNTASKELMSIDTFEQQQSA